ncbi:RluA family pseudouridine synthase [Aquabacterium sp.]|uniref:RluA family pseudouridine synthase n=1 Tax=Aquabacterium sp. TaxID=1872578 RepID=UPI0035AFEDDD
MASRPTPPHSPASSSVEETLVQSGAEEWDGDDEGAAGQVEAPPEWASKESLVATADRGHRLDAWLAVLAPEYSRSHLKTLIESGCVTVDGSLVSTASRKVVPGQRIAVLLRPTAQSQAFVAEKMDLPIVYEDDALIVINKPPGMVVHPAAGNWSGTLMNGLLAHHAGASALPRAGIVHRLDKDTSGLMVVGKTIEAVTALSRAIADRAVRRQYVALVHGLAPDAMEVDAPIGRDPVSRVRMAVQGAGKPARTDVRCLMRTRARLDDGWGQYSAVECTLHTGRTHQIRVHLSSKGLPLVADVLYGGKPALGMGRQALHAFRLGFIHPSTGEACQFESPLPSDMASAWRILQEAAEKAATGA